MIFAADTDERSLHVFYDADTATAYCDALAVEAALWLFWDDRGAPLVAEFFVPNKRGLFRAQNGEYALVPTLEADYALLGDALQQIRQVIGEPPFTDVNAVQAYLDR